MVAEVGFAPEASMRRLYLALVFVIVLVALIFQYGHFTYAQQPAALVIEGGTLIDGNGGAPVPDSVVVIQGSKITAVSRKGASRDPGGRAGHQCHRQVRAAGSVGFADGLQLVLRRGADDSRHHVDD
jgi:hypothetical protein